MKKLKEFITEGSLQSQHIYGIIYNVSIRLDGKNLVFQFIPKTSEEIDKITDENKVGNALAIYVKNRMGGDLKCSFDKSNPGAGLNIIAKEYDLITFFEMKIK